jgi:hypothetical protein
MRLVRIIYNHFHPGVCNKVFCGPEILTLLLGCIIQMSPTPHVLHFRNRTDFKCLSKDHVVSPMEYNHVAIVQD